MKFDKKALTCIMSLTLSANLFAQEIYNMQNKTLKEALDIISQKSNLSYIINDNLLESEQKFSINAKGVEKALKELFSDTNLKAIIKNDAIIIVQKDKKAEKSLENSQSVSLAPMLIQAQPLHETYEVNVGAFGKKDNMEIPIIMQSYDYEAINKISPQSAIDVLKRDPSIESASYGGSFDNFVLRGFPMDFFNTIRKDGLSLSPHQDYTLEAVQRIDVLKGPSGFIYGFNSPGGSINYVSKRPTKESLMNISTRVSSLNNKYIAIDNSESFFDKKIGYRLNLGYDKKGNFKKANNYERKFIALSTDFKINENTLLQINADYSNKLSTSDPLLRADQSSRKNLLDPSTYILPPKVDRRELLAPSWYRYETIAQNFDTKLEYRFNPNWIWISQLGYSLVKRDGGFNDLFDIKPNGDIGYADYYNARGSNYKTYQGQTYLSGKFDTKSIYHDFFIGSSYKRYKDRTPEWDFIESKGKISVSDVSVGNILNPKEPKVWNFGAKKPIGSIAGTKEFSLFMSDLIYLNDNFQILAGSRFIHFKTTDPGYNLKPQNKKVLVPTAALIYRPNDDLMTYLSYSKGFEKGDYAPAFANNALQPTDAIESEQYEIGIKSNINENIFASIAAFDITRGASYLNSNKDYVSDGKFNHRGVEFNAMAKVFSRLNLVGNFAYLNTKLKDVTDEKILNKKSEGIPKLKASLSAQYQINKNFSFDTSLDYIGKRPIDAQNSGFMPSYSVANAGLTYRTKIKKSDLTLRLSVNNIFDKYYYSSVIYSGGLGLGKPREVFLLASLSF